MSKIYTRAGDEGETGLFGGSRVRKDDPRVEAMGTIDELNAALGVVRADLARGADVLAELDSVLAQVQHRLFDMGAELATREPNGHTVSRLSDRDITGLEEVIDRYENQLPPLREFILPGGAAAAAQMHFARSVCRRAERRLVTLMDCEPVRGELLRYLNRLSDLMFVAARLVNQAEGVADVKWDVS